MVLAIAGWRGLVVFPREYRGFCGNSSAVANAESSFGRRVPMLIFMGLFGRGVW